MKYVGKIIIVLLALAVSYYGYSFFQLRKELFTVYDIDEKYTYTPEQYDLTVVDFNNYHCKRCQDIHPVFMEALKKDGKVRYIPRSVTNGFAWSETLASAVYAAAEQDKFIEMHNMIYEKWPVNDRDTLFRYAKTIGLDTKKLSRDMSKPETIEKVRTDQQHFEAWGLGRTPAYIMGEKAIYMPVENMPTVEKLLEKFDRARN